MYSNWLWAGIAILVGIVIGTIASKFAQRFASAPNRPDGLRESASAVGSMAFSLCLVIGLMAALGIVKATALDKIIDDLVSYLPRAISAGIVLILGNIAGTLAGTAAAQAFGRAAGKAAGSVPRMVKSVIMGFAAILAAAQLGVDTTVVNIAVAAILFSLGLAAALLIGFGGRAVSSEIAAGRALRRVVAPGDMVRTDVLNGRVLTVHSTAIEMEVDGESMLIPNSEILDSTLAISRLDPEPAQD